MYSSNNNAERSLNTDIHLTIMLKDHWTLVYAGNNNAEIRLNIDIYTRYNNAVHKNSFTTAVDH